MSRSRSTSWRRFICTTLLWSLALLLLANVGWSVWFSQHFAEVYGIQFVREIVGYPSRWPSRFETHDERRITIWRSEYTSPESMWLTQFNVTVVSLNSPDFSSPGLAESAGSLSVPRWVKVDHWNSDPPTLINGVAHEMYVGVGYPVRLLWCRWVRQGSAFVVDRSTAILRSDDPQPWIGQVDRVLPFRPIWSGQLLTGAIALGVVAVIRFLVYLWRHGLCDLRRWRGLCENCAYDLRGNVSGVCPECGASVNGKGAGG